MKSIATRFMLLVGLFVVLFCSFVLYRTYTDAKRQTTELLDRQAALAVKFDLAIRDYAGKKIRPIMEQHAAPGEFIAETMSTSFVARSIFESVREEFPDYIIKFSSDDPRNPANRAGPAELRMLGYFREHPGVDRWAGGIDIDGKQYFAQFRARRTDESCLRCHGRPEDAPAALVERYGSTAGFNRQVGQVIALDTVAIPMADAHTALLAEMKKQIPVIAGGLTLLFLVVAGAFRFMVTKRLRAMARHFQETTDQTDGSRVTTMAISGDDEIASLAQSYNDLADRLRASHTLLEERVRQRTAALAQANEDLRVSREAQSQILRGTSIPLFVIDRNHVVTHWNRACENLTNVAAKDMVGTNRQWSAFYGAERPVLADLVVDQRPQEHVAGLYGSKYRPSSVLAGAYEVEGFFPHFGDQGMCLFFTAAPLRDPAGQIVGAIETFQDITERVNAEKELERRIAEVSEAKRRLEVLVSNTTDREKRMVDLKQEVNALLSTLGREPKYKVPQQVAELTRGLGKSPD